MCGRYDFDINIEEIKEIIKDIPADNSFHVGEICPTDDAPIMINDNNVVVPKLTKWGFPNAYGKGVIINARAENVSNTFSKAFKNRCIVPSTGFYEWDLNRQKYLFRLPNESVLYMAALYDNDRFLIVTTAANDSVRKVHERMPLILTNEIQEDWIYSLESTKEYILKMVPPEVVKIPI